MDMPIGENGNASRYDQVADEQFAFPDADYPRITPAQMAAHIRRIIKPRRNANILIDRFGLGLPRPANLGEIACKYNVTRQRVEQVVKIAMATLRRPANAGALKALIGESDE